MDMQIFLSNCRQYTLEGNYSTRPKYSVQNGHCTWFVSPKYLSFFLAFLKDFDILYVSLNAELL